jgi:methylphosphotriester-DNA--protein-cysteine methyltransferase
MLVKAELEKLHIPYTTVELGEVETAKDLSTEQLEQLKTALLRSGLELMDDKRAMLVEKIKNVIVEAVHYSDEFPEMNFSDYLVGKLHHDYTHMANIFSQTKGITIEHYLIFHKIEKVKELLVYDELTLTQIAQKLNYSSTAHLSNQLKKITGLTPTFFKSIVNQRRSSAKDV